MNDIFDGYGNADNDEQGDRDYWNEERTGGVNDHLEDDREQWCSRCEHWREACECDNEEPLALDQTESCCQWIDNQTDRYWEESVRDYPRNEER